MQHGKPAVICLSGGMDSTSLLLHLLARERSVFGISFDYGQKHSIELQRLKGNLAYLLECGFHVDWQLVDLSGLSKMLHSALTDPSWEVPEGYYESENMKQTVVPNRNAIFASIAYAKALSIANRRAVEVDLCLGVHAGDHAIYPDCKPEFYDAIFAAFAMGNWDSEKVTKYLPYIEFDKARILLDAQDSIEKLGLNFETVFANTITSYAPDASGRSSGLTGSDVERILAFNEIGRRDPIEYELTWQQVVDQAIRLQQEFKAQQ